MKRAAGESQDSRSMQQGRADVQKRGTGRANGTGRKAPWGRKEGTREAKKWEGRKERHMHRREGKSEPLAVHLIVCVCRPRPSIAPYAKYSAWPAHDPVDTAYLPTAAICCSNTTQYERVLDRRRIRENVPSAMSEKAKFLCLGVRAKGRFCNEDEIPMQDHMAFRIRPDKCVLCRPTSLFPVELRIPDIRNMTNKRDVRNTRDKKQKTCQKRVDVQQRGPCGYSWVLDTVRLDGRAAMQGQARNRR